MVCRWINEYETHGDQAFIGHGNARINSEFEIKKLKNQLEVLQKECEVLKKYLTFLKEQNSKSFSL